MVIQLGLIEPRHSPLDRKQFGMTPTKLCGPANYRMFHRSRSMLLLSHIPRWKRDPCRRASVGPIDVLEVRCLLANGITLSGAPQINGSPGVALSGVKVASF